MSEYMFGSGILWGTPLTDASGVAIAVPTPVIFGVMQDVSVDISADTKMLYGQNQFPVAVGRGKGKITGKAKFAQLNGAIINGLFFGQTVTSGILAANYDTTGVVVATTVTLVAPGSGTISQNLGVISSTGVPLTQVASAPATGQYSYAAGVWTFAAADVGTTVFINYQYTSTSTTAKKSTVMNIPMGYTPSWRADFFNSYSGKSISLTLYNCVSSKLTFATKQDDFGIPEMDFDAFADGTNRVLTWGTSE